MSALDELLARWRDNPDAGATLALSAYLGGSRDLDLVREVGATAEAWHKDDAEVMIATGRMYLDAGLFAEAQAALVAAGRVPGADGSAFRYLGEVLLRRGDAARAEKVLARALQLGAPQADVRLWYDRAVVYVPLQARAGLRAVAEEIDRTVPRRTSIAPPTLTAGQVDALGPRAAPRAPRSPGEPPVARPGGPAMPAARGFEPPTAPVDARDELPTQVYSMPPLTEIAAAAAAAAISVSGGIE